MKNLAKLQLLSMSVVSGGLLMLGASSAFATGPDVTAITTAITDAGTAAATVASAVLVMIVGIKVYKWIRRGL